MSANPATSTRSAAMPATAEALLRQGFARHQAGDLAGAEAVYRKVLAAAPSDHRGLTLLASLLERQGDLDAAAALYRQALAADPTAPAPRQQLAALSLRRGDARAAHDLITPFTAARPNDPKGWRLRARAAQALDDATDAIESYAQALAAGDAAAAAPLGKLRQEARDWAGAAAAYERALPLDPDNAGLNGALGNVYAKLGRRQDAIRMYRQAIALDPDLASAHAALGLELYGVGRYEDAAASYARALEITPDDPDVANNLANLRLAQGRPRLAQAMYRDVIAAHPDYPSAPRNLCMAIAYDDGASSADLAAACRDAVADLPVARRPALPETGGRPLRVGFVSADLRSHSVAAFVEPLFAHFDPAEIACIAYSLTEAADRVTDRLKGMASAWRDVAKLSDQAIADQVRADNVDLLIDLAGHTGEAHLGCFALRPAPAQASWLGWPSTTGLEAIDFKLSDHLLTPADATEAFAETPHNLAGPALCFQPPDDAPAVAPPPMLTNGYPTFGSFNRIFKASPRTLALWAAVLERLPEARLLLKDAALRCPDTSARMLSRLGAAGVDPGRVTLIGSTASRAAHLELYGQVDVALDSVPYNGVTTTSEALWMGVPTVTLIGDRSLARYGLTVLTHAGMAQCVAADPAEFVAKAVDLVADPERLAQDRARMRHRLLASPLLDGPAFARSFAAACREMVAIIRARTEG